MRMSFAVFAFFVLFCFGESFGIIYQLNDTEYERLPPLFELENYESCMQNVEGVYCVANIELYTDTQNDLYTLIQEYSEHTLKHYNYSKLDRGVCVTRTCEHFARNTGLDINRDTKSVLEGCLNETMINKYDLMARICYLNCEKQTDGDQTQVDYVDYIVLAVFMMLVVFTLFGSYYDIYLNENKVIQNPIKGKEFILCFSIFQNLKKLTSVELSDPRLNLLKGLHGIRTLTTCLVVYAHVMFLISAGFTSDPHTFEKAFESSFQRQIFSATCIIQIFFFISGLLLTYFLQIFSETYEVSWKAIPKIIFQRWWRLTPPAALTVAFMATWMRHLSYGPLWNTYVTNGPTEQCRRFFWAHVFYFNNYLIEDTSCALHTWHIAADMQLFIVGLIIHFAIRNRSTRLKIITLGTMLMVGIASPVLHIWFQDLDPVVFRKPEVTRTLYEPTLRILHMLGHNNLSCFIIGMAAGYWIYYKQQNKMDYSNFKIGDILCWCVLPMYILVVYFASLFCRDGERPAVGLRMLYAATYTAVIGIINTVWIVGVMFKFNSLSRFTMEWSAWVVPSKLSYSVYLLHYIFIHILLGVRTQLTPVSFLNVFFITLGIIVATYVIALPFYLLVEAPATRIIKLLANQNIKKKSE